MLPPKPRLALVRVDPGYAGSGQACIVQAARAEGWTVTILLQDA